MEKKVRYLAQNRNLSVSDLKEEFRKYYENQKWFMKNYESLSRGVYDTETILLYLERKALASKLDRIFENGSHMVSMCDDGEIVAKKSIKSSETKKESVQGEVLKKRKNCNDWSFLKILGCMQQLDVFEAEKSLECRLKRSSNKNPEPFKDDFSDIANPGMKKGPVIKDTSLFEHESTENLQDKNGEAVYICPVSWCAKKYRTKNGLEYHTKIGCIPKDDYTRPYKCEYPECNKRYKNRNGLKYHQLHGHNVKEI